MVQLVNSYITISDHTAATVGNRKDRKREEVGYRRVSAGEAQQNKRGRNEQWVLATSLVLYGVSSLQG